MRLFNVTVYLMICTALALGAASEAKPKSDTGNIILANRAMSIKIDRQSGAWISLLDRSSSDEMIVGPNISGVAPADATSAINIKSIQNAVFIGNALSIEGDWQFCPDPKVGGESAGFLKGDYSAGEWVSTPVPSRTGIGDNRLHDRVGEFWYRTTFTPRPEWKSGDLILAIGAIDDTDVTYLNGERIGSTGLDVPHHWETPRFYTIPSRLIHRNKPNTLLIKVNNGAFDGGVTSGPVVIGLPSAIKPPIAPLPPLQKVKTTRNAGISTVSMTANSGPYEYTIEYHTQDDSMILSRTITVRNISAAPQILSTVTYPMPSLRVGAKQMFSFPGSLPIGDNPVSALAEGEFVRSRSMDPFAVLWDNSTKRGIGMWYHSEDEWAPVAVKRISNGAVIQHTQEIVAPLAPGQSVKLGTQYIWLEHGNRDAVLSEIHKIYDAIDLHAPSGGMLNLGSKVLYCGHPGGVPEHNYRGYGGFKAIEAYLPTLKRLNVGLLWLLPIWEHGDGTIWNLYSPFDHFKVSPLYGTPDELKQLSAGCTRNEIGLMFDLVPHGPPDTTPLAKEHPEWLCRDQEGKPIYNWSQCAFEYANPDWENYMMRAAEFDADEYSAIGARIDCGAGGPMNWKPLPGLRPSQSCLYGGMHMDNAIREGFVKAGKKTILMPEEYTSANVFYRVSDMTYDAMFFFLILDLKAKNATPQEWAGSLQTFLHDQSLTLPQGGVKMRFISNHDTVSWTFQAKRPIDVYGIDGMRALLSLCALIDGVPMLYQGDEDPSIYGGKGQSSVGFLSKVYGLRRTVPAIAHGSVDYTSIKATGGVFACLRQSNNEEAIVLISLNLDAVTSKVSLPANIKGRWVDRISGEQMSVDSGCNMPMSPYQVRVLTPVVGVPHAIN